MAFKWLRKTRKCRDLSKVDFIREDYKNIKPPSFASEIHSFNTSFVDCFRPILCVIQLAGLLPINCRDNRFSIWSIKYLYSSIIALLLLGLSLCSLAEGVSLNFEFDKIIEFMFYFIDFLVVVLFQLLGHHWRNILTVWSDFERTLNTNEQLLRRRFSLRVAFQLIILVGTVMTLVTEILGLIAGLEKSGQCSNEPSEKVHRYFKVQFSEIFSIIEYSFWMGIILQLFKFICTFIRMFLDVFLMLISLGLCRLIDRLNLQFSSARSNRVINDDLWIRYKDQYLRFMELVAFVDSRIGYVTIICFLSDLYLICVRLLKSFNSLDTLCHAMYFWYALCFLIARLVCVCYFASNLHKSSKRPLILLRKVPASCWSVEAQRFQDLVIHNDVCLTGLGFFKLRRTLLLSVSQLKKFSSILNNKFIFHPTDQWDNCYIRTGPYAVQR